LLRNITVLIKSTKQQNRGLKQSKMDVIGLYIVNLGIEKEVLSFQLSKAFVETDVCSQIYACSQIVRNSTMPIFI